MQICNACRYCEGLCAVFPAMVQRRSFTDQDLDYLANLCHNCQACYHGCQYAPPHAFEVNVPKTLTNLRADTWLDYAWPSLLAQAFKRNGLVLFVLMAFAISAVLIITALSAGEAALFKVHAGGDFYQLLPHNLMLLLAAPIFLFSILALLLTLRNYWRGTASPKLGMDALGALRDILSLKNLGGGAAAGKRGCNTNSERFSMARRYFHHATFYGFMLCFAATCVGTVYHYFLDWQAPYAYLSLPVILGTTGGILLCMGTAGLYYQKRIMVPEVQVKQLHSMENTFIFLLFATSLSGLLLLVLRETSWLGITLSLHIGFVLAFFACIPYSKMVHALYRGAALARFHLEQTK